MITQKNAWHFRHNPRHRRAHGMTLLAFGAALLLGGQSASALGPVHTPDTWGGDLATRARLSGDWGGHRDQLARKGVVLDLDFALTPQTVMSGGRDTGTVGWGNAIYTLNIDTAKAGWWPGAYINVKGDSSFGNAGTKEIGAIAPANLSILVPEPLQPASGLESATLTQFLSQRFALMMGKIFTLDLGHGEFYGNMHTQFMNSALNLPTATALVPLSAFGGGALFLPTHDITVVALALDPSGEVMSNDIGDAFDDGVLFLGAVSLKTRLFGLPGNQAVTGMWSDKTRLSLDQDPANLARTLLAERYPRLGDPGPVLEKILQHHFPNLAAPIQPLGREDDTWAISYAFDQYVWQPGAEAGRGLGVFFNIGITDGNPNPIKYSYLVGIGGKGIVPGRPRDNFGIGWARTQFSDEFVPFLRDRLDLGLQHEDTVEMYYNASITPWLNVSPSIQIIDSGLERALNEKNQLEDLDTAAVFFLRTFIRL